jgi:hypothetical protein
MRFDHVRRVALIASLFTATLTLAPIAARAEIITLQCSSTFVIDLAAGTAKKRANTYPSGYTDIVLTQVAITDSTISFVNDLVHVTRDTFHIDRITGDYQIEFYYYPEGRVRGAPRATGHCDRIPNKVF